MVTSNVDLVVIGGGSGGVRAARIAAGHGARVLLAEEYRIGGTCAIRGCVPKKLMVYASHLRRELDHAIGFGWTIPSARFDWETLTSNIEREISRLEAAYTSNLEKAGVRIARSRAVLLDRNTVRCANGEIVRAGHILLATGSIPNQDRLVPGLSHVISSNEIFRLTTQPKRIVIQGGGYIALEFACIFAALGSDVTVVCRSENILRGFDEDLRSHMRSEIERAGITVLTRCTVMRVDKSQDGYISHISNGSNVSSDQVLFAIGRHPNIDGLGLDQAGVELNPVTGGIAVNQFSQTSATNIYAVGDVTHRVNLTPVAIREGHAFADSIFGSRPTCVNHDDIPTAVFTQPEVGTVGLTEEQALSRHACLKIYKADFRPLKATLSADHSRVMMKLVVDAGTDRILGCHIVGPDAGELIQVIGIAVKMKATKADFDKTMAVHPTAAEELVTLRLPTRIVSRSETHFSDIR